jgi:hypothetical protein
MAHDLVLFVHVAAGSVALSLGPLAMWAERRPPYRSRSGPVDPVLAMTEGFQTAFLVVLGIAVLGALLAALLFRRQEGIEDATIEARRVPPCPPTLLAGF